MQFRFVSKSKGFFTNELEMEIKKANSTAKKKPLLKKIKFRTIEEKLNSWQRSALLKIQDENGNKYYKISTSLKCGFHQLKSFMNESSFELLDKLENNIDEWRKSFLYKAWFSSNGKLEFDNIEILAFLLFNGAIDSLPECLSKEIINLISSFEKYKSLVTTVKYTICKTEHLSDTEIYYKPIEEINMLQKAS